MLRTQQKGKIVEPSTLPKLLRRHVIKHDHEPHRADSALHLETSLQTDIYAAFELTVCARASNHDEASAGMSFS